MVLLGHAFLVFQLELGITEGGQHAGDDALVQLAYQW